MKSKSNLMRKLSIVSIIVMGLALLLCIPQVAEKVGEWTNRTGSEVANLAKSVLIGAVGVYLISAGVASLAVPVLGAVLIVVGLALVGWAVYPYFKRQETFPEVEPED